MDLWGINHLSMSKPLCWPFSVVHLLELYNAYFGRYCRNWLSFIALQMYPFPEHLPAKWQFCTYLASKAFYSNDFLSICLQSNDFVHIWCHTHFQVTISLACAFKVIILYIFGVKCILNNDFLSICLDSNNFVHIWCQTHFKLMISLTFPSK